MLIQMGYPGGTQAINTNQILTFEINRRDVKQMTLIAWVVFLQLLEGLHSKRSRLTTHLAFPGIVATHRYSLQVSCKRNHPLLQGSYCETDDHLIP